MVAKRFRWTKGKPDPIVWVNEDGKQHKGEVRKYGKGRNSRKVLIYFPATDQQCWYMEYHRDIVRVEGERDTAPAPAPSPAPSSRTTGKRRREIQHVVEQQEAAAVMNETNKALQATLVAQRKKRVLEEACAASERLATQTQAGEAQILELLRARGPHHHYTLYICFYRARLCCI